MFICLLEQNHIPLKMFTLENILSIHIMIKNNDKKHLKGDYMSSNIDNNVVIVPSNGNVKVDTKIDFVIP